MDAGTKAVSIDLSDCKYLYSVLYYHTGGENYWGGQLQPMSLFDIHPQVLSAPLATNPVTVATGIVSYDKTTHTLTIQNNSNNWTVYVYKVR